ncbi:trypsin-like peptidase domain-containing protein [Botrimarina sp.]|uniref:S1C family serine protease n=1 Tax=Botrimarina sp. TaxID=2795802 RepID=UPI0032EC7857
MSGSPVAGMMMAALLAATAAGAAPPLRLSPEVRAIESQRQEVIERVCRSTVAIFERSAGNGGSGVIISDDGLVVTNFHVTAPCGALMLCATSDGRVHDAVLLGLDPTGDIALVQLIGEGPFPAAEIGDSDTVAVGQPALVVGNPFLLAEDFRPTVTAGVISGVHRYQYPSGTLLEYADCLQTDAAINPGNSGGPLFDGSGRLIGINGRGSFEKRGRVNVGVGYAVSINQVMRFVPGLRAGRIADHAALGATVATRSGPQTIVTAIETASDAYRRGLRAGDEVVSVEGRDTPTANALLNAVGVLPAGWRTRIEYRRDGRLYEAEVRLRELHAPGELIAAVAEMTPEGDPPPEAPPEALYSQRDGYANYAANRDATERLVDACRVDSVVGAVDRRYADAAQGVGVQLRLTESSAEWLSPRGEYSCDPSRDLATQATPLAAPELLGSLWVWRTLAAGEAAVLDQVEALGALPWEALGEPHDVLAVTHHGLRVELYFEPQTGRLRGIEGSRDAALDATRVDLGAASQPGAPLSSMAITVGDRTFAELSPAEANP